jgi:hypothetical protein
MPSEPLAGRAPILCYENPLGWWNTLQNVRLVNQPGSDNDHFPYMWINK